MKPKKITFIEIAIYLMIGVFIILIAGHFINAYDIVAAQKDEKPNMQEVLSLFIEMTNKNLLVFKKTEHLVQGLAITIGVLAVIVLYLIDGAKKKTMPGGEYGTAHWTSPNSRLVKSWKHKDYKKNAILAEGIEIRLENYKTQINYNHLIYGPSGAGKSHRYMKPNVMNAYGCYIIVDPKLEILEQTGNILRNKNYAIKVYNINDLEKSCHYNPMAYIEKDDDVVFLVKTLLLNTKADKDSHSAEGFWDDASELLLCTLISYVMYCYPKEKQNIPSVLELMQEANDYQEKNNNKEPEITLLDIKMENLKNEIKKKEASDPNGLYPEKVVLKYYKDFKMAPKKTSMSVLISVSARTKFFHVETIRKSSLDDEMDLFDIGLKKMAIFVAIPPTDLSKQFLSSILFTQVLKIIERNAKMQENQKLPEVTRIMIDEAANVGTIPGMKEAIAYVRGYNAGVTLVYQSKAQLEAQYKDDWKSIVENSHCLLYLGGQENDTLKYISEKLGTTTIYTKDRSISKGSSSSSSENEKGMGRELMKPDEVGDIPDDMCILFVKGKKFYVPKYKTEHHPMFKGTSMYNPTRFERLRGKEKISEYDFFQDLKRERRRKERIQNKIAHNGQKENEDTSFYLEKSGISEAEIEEITNNLANEVNATLMQTNTGVYKKEIKEDLSEMQKKIESIRKKVIQKIEMDISEKKEHRVEFSIQELEDMVNEQIAVQIKSGEADFLKVMDLKDNLKLVEEIRIHLQERMNGDMVSYTENIISQSQNHLSFAPADEMAPKKKGEVKKQLDTILEQAERTEEIPDVLKQKLVEQMNSGLEEKTDSIKCIPLNYEALVSAGVITDENVNEDEYETVEDEAEEDALMEKLSGYM